MTAISMSRRRALLGGAALAGTASFGGWPAPEAQAKAPFAKDQAPYFYRFAHGKMQATVVSDGVLPLGEPSGTFLGTSKEEIGKLLADNFLSPANVVLEQNALILNTGDRLVLFDSGMGTSAMFGKSTGRLIKSMQDAGIDPGAIDAVVITHAHIDHIGGLVGSGDNRLFPNAQIYMSQVDFEFWTDEKKLAGATKDFVEHARKNLLPYRDRIVFIKDGQEFLPGIQAMAAPGHTVGHTVFMITSDGKTMCNVGDLTHHQILLVERPRMEFAYDTDPKQAASTRVRILETLASSRIPLLAYHFPWPGVGHVAKSGDGFRYFPAPLQMDMDQKG